MKDIRINVVQVSCDQSGGEGGVSQKLTFAHRGGGGGVWRGAKSAHVILEQPLNQYDRATSTTIKLMRFHIIEIILVENFQLQVSFAFYKL